MTLARLDEILDAYGAAPARWPEAERTAVLELLAHSPDARRHRDDAAVLDGLLDAVPAAPPSPALAARILAASPRRRVARRALIAFVPLAAAAAVTLWLGLEGQPTRRVAAHAIAVGEYSSPTDVLLGSYGVADYATVPGIGCDDSVLGCPGVAPAAGKSQSLRQTSGRARA